jgi:hypothetical protein
MGPIVTFDFTEKQRGRVGGLELGAAEKCQVCWREYIPLDCSESPNAVPICIEAPVSETPRAEPQSHPRAANTARSKAATAALLPSASVAACFIVCRRSFKRSS